MQRRQFMGAVVAGAAVSSISHVGAVNAGTRTGLESAFAGSLYYTKENPGRWNAKVAGHLPEMNTSNKNGKVIVQVTTPHEMKGYEHYIVKHQLFDGNMNLLGETLFDPNKNAPVSNYDVTGYKGLLYAVSVCNKHDAWVISKMV